MPILMNVRVCGVSEYALSNGPDNDVCAMDEDEADLLSNGDNNNTSEKRLTEKLLFLSNRQQQHCAAATSTMPKKKKGGVDLTMTPVDSRIPQLARTHHNLPQPATTHHN